MAEYGERLLLAGERLKVVAAANLGKQGIDVNDGHPRNALEAAERLKAVAAENLRKQGIDVTDPCRHGLGDAAERSPSE